MDEIPFSRAEITKDDKDAVMRVLDSRIVAMGKATEELEAAFCKFYSKRCAVALSSGTAGLHLALTCSGIDAAKRPLAVPTYTFIATMHAAVAAYGVDNARLVDQVSTEDADIPCHLFGEPSVHAVKEHSIVDACESIGDLTLPLGRAAVFSFWANKQIVTGEGGMLVTDDASLAGDVRALANHGRYAGAPIAGLATCPGYNYRMDEMSAALGLSQFKRLPEILARRRLVAYWYNERLAELSYSDGSPFIGWPAPRESWFVYNIQVPRSARDYICRALADKGIQCRKYFEFPVHKHPAYRQSGFPVADWLAARCIALPFFNEMTEQQVTRVTQALGELLHTVAPEKPYEKQDLVDKYHKG